MLTDFGFLRCLAGFFTGMLLFTFYEHGSGFNIIKRDWFFAISVIGLFAAMHFGVMDIIIVVFFPLIIISAACNQTAVKRILDTKVLQRLGDWSFTIYMVHIPIIFTFYTYYVIKNHALFADLQKLFAQKPNYMENAGMCLMIIALTLIVASLTYRFVEVPTRNYLNKAFSTKKPRVEVESAKVESVEV
jgi:peptidoglycan/LPS O-acetylase OafA/YrhL